MHFIVGGNFSKIWAKDEIEQCGTGVTIPPCVRRNLFCKSVCLCCVEAIEAYTGALTRGKDIGGRIMQWDRRFTQNI
jgi:hypothetical protein